MQGTPILKMGAPLGTIGTLLFDGRIILKSPWGTIFFDKDNEKTVSYFYPTDAAFNAYTDEETGEKYDHPAFATHPSRKGKDSLLGGGNHPIDALNLLVKQVLEKAREGGNTEVSEEDSETFINRAIDEFNANHRQGKRPLPEFNSPAWRRIFVNGHDFAEEADQGTPLFDKDGNLLTYFPAFGGKNQHAIESGFIPFAQELRQIIAKDLGEGFAEGALAHPENWDVGQGFFGDDGVHIEPQHGMAENVFRIGESERGSGGIVDKNITRRYLGSQIEGPEPYKGMSLNIRNLTGHLNLGFAAPTITETRGRKSTTEKHRIGIYRDMLKNVDDATPLPDHFKNIARENERDFDTIGEVKTALEEAIVDKDSENDALYDTLKRTFGASELGKLYLRFNQTDSKKDRKANARLFRQSSGPGKRLMESVREQARQRGDLLHGIEDEDGLHAHFEGASKQLRHLSSIASAVGTHESGVSNMKYMETGIPEHDDWVNNNQKDAEAYHDIYSQMAGQSPFPFSNESSKLMGEGPPPKQHHYNPRLQAPAASTEMVSRFSFDNPPEAAQVSDDQRLIGTDPDDLVDTGNELPQGNQRGEQPLPADAPPGMAPETPTDPFARPPPFRMPSTALPSAETMVDPRLAAMWSMGGRIQANRPTYAGDPTGGFYERVVPQRGYKVVPPGYKVVPQAPRRGFLQFLRGRRR